MLVSRLSAFDGCRRLMTPLVNYLNGDPIEGITLPQSESLGDWKPNAEISNEKIREKLGATFRPVADTVRATVLGALEVGWTQ